MAAHLSAAPEDLWWEPARFGQREFQGGEHVREAPGVPLRVHCANCIAAPRILLASHAVKRLEGLPLACRAARAQLERILGPCDPVREGGNSTPGGLRVAGMVTGAPSGLRKSAISASAASELRCH